MDDNAEPEVLDGGSHRALNCRLTVHELTIVGTDFKVLACSTCHRAATMLQCANNPSIAMGARVVEP